ncbi:MAG: carbamoyl phosphate synthase small subunit [Clostridiales bacterium]|nr:carbamoyl phosphate synthase small subunit [Clostridiales bacterium]
MKKAYLILDGGQVFEGYRFGAEGDALGELVFTTGMVGYIETLTDPSYYGQIVLQTFPLIGNYGIISEDFEGKPAARGYVVREWCDTPSNFRSEGTVDEFLKKAGIPGIWGVDTREITRIIRERGVMNAIIADSVPADLSQVHSYTITDAVKNVSCAAPITYPAQGEENFKVTLIDYGFKMNIVRELIKRGCAVTVVPYHTPAEEILAARPDGVMLSNGPGDPEENVESIREIQKLLGRVPIFGICLGHQLLALANGGKTVKLKYGHRGANQPAKELYGKRTYITSQNHGYAVVSDSIGDVGRVTMINANDGTCEGIEYPTLHAFSVQFHPEACSGPLDTNYLFDQFFTWMGGKENAAE